MRIMLHRLWRYHRHRFLMPGPYRVPLDISKELAERALKAGVAERIPEPKPARPVEVETEAGEEERAPRRRKGPAPENKARGKAPVTKRRADDDD